MTGSSGIEGIWTNVLSIRNRGKSSTRSWSAWPGRDEKIAYSPWQIQKIKERSGFPLRVIDPIR
jgi:hypothetical protein